MKYVLFFIFCVAGDCQIITSSHSSQESCLFAQKQIDWLAKEAAKAPITGATCVPQ